MAKGFMTISSYLRQTALNTDLLVEQRVEEIHRAVLRLEKRS